jgi:hypothetical protein
VMVLSLLLPANAGASNSKPRSLTLPVLATAKPYETEVPATAVKQQCWWAVRYWRWVQECKAD